MTRYLDCPACADEQLFEQPGCVDGHGPECPEWFCASCGRAIVLGYVPMAVRHVATVAA